MLKWDKTIIVKFKEANILMKPQKMTMVHFMKCHWYLKQFLNKSNTFAKDNRNTKTNKPHDFSILKYSRKSGLEITEAVTDSLANIEQCQAPIQTH